MRAVFVTGIGLTVYRPRVTGTIGVLPARGWMAEPRPAGRAGIENDARIRI
jgi:hypothetical protein